eukprot:4490968-Pleurochrysis_carterae.AAC.2
MKRDRTYNPETLATKVETLKPDHMKGIPDGHSVKQHRNRRRRRPEQTVCTALETCLSVDWVNGQISLFGSERCRDRDPVHQKVKVLQSVGGGTAEEEDKMSHAVV